MRLPEFGEIEYLAIVVVIVIGCFLALSIAGVFTNTDFEERKIEMLQKMAEQEGQRVIHSKGIHGNYKLASITGTDTWFHLVFEDTEDELQIKMELVFFPTYNSWNLHSFSQVPI